MNTLSSYCGLVVAQIRASDKDLPVPSEIKPHLKNPPCLFFKVVCEFIRVLRAGTYEKYLPFFY